MEIQKKKEAKKITPGCLIAFGIFLVIGVVTKNCGSNNSDNKDAKQTETENKKVIEIPKQLSDGEYLNDYSSKLQSVKLDKMFGVAPLYGNYADALNNVLLDMERNDSLFHIFNNKKIKSLHDKYRKTQEKALLDYVKYGNPDDEDNFFIFTNSACESALQTALNDPDYDVVKDKYYLKQTAKGYDYKLLIRGKNAFGAKILKEMTFSLQYNPLTKEYNVINVR